MKTIAQLALLLTLALPLAAQQPRGRDPLTPVEADKLRDTAMEPNHRLKLYVEFARVRITSIDQLLTDNKTKDRSTQLHDLLQDFSTLSDEIDDNVDTYASEQWDIRKSLKLVIEGDAEFQLKLRKLADFTADPHNSADADSYKFALQDAMESLNASADDARKTMQEQNTLAKANKLKKESEQK